MSARFFVCGFKLFLEYCLNFNINGSVKIVAVNRINNTLVLIRHFIAISIARGYDLSGSTRKLFVIIIFKSVKTVAVTSREAKHVGCKIAVSVISDAHRLNVDAIRYLKLAYKLKNRVRLIGGSLAKHCGIKALGLARHGKNRVIVDRKEL